MTDELLQRATELKKRIDRYKNLKSALELIDHDETGSGAFINLSLSDTIRSRVGNASDLSFKTGDDRLKHDLVTFLGKRIESLEGEFKGL